MRKDAIQLEETRLQGIRRIQDYPNVHERHRVFPAIFEDRHHKTILDVAAGVGCAAQRIQENYPADLLCNDITPTCLTILKQLGLRTVSFDLDDDERPLSFSRWAFRCHRFTGHYRASTPCRSFSERDTSHTEQRWVSLSDITQLCRPLLFTAISTVRQEPFMIPYQNPHEHATSSTPMSDILPTGRCWSL